MARRIATVLSDEFGAIQAIVPVREDGTRMVSATATKTRSKNQPPLMSGAPLVLEYTRLATASIPISPHGTGPDSALVENVRNNGILEPLLVRREKNRKGAEVIRLLEGRRRLISATWCEFPDVPVLIVSGDVSDDAIRLAVHGLRRNNPVHEVQAIEALIRKGHSESDIAKAVGFSTATIQERQLYLRLVPALLQAFYTGKILASVAKAASALSVGQQSELAELLERNGKLTAKDVKAMKLASRANQDVFDGLETPDESYEPTGLPNEVKAFLLDAKAKLEAGVDYDVQIDLARQIAELLDAYGTD